MQAARATMLDIAAATRVEQKIQDPAHPAYARQVLGDDSKIEAELKSMAQNVTFPTPLDQERQLVLKDLDSSDGAQLEPKLQVF
jgi:predicted outer membrane protein